MQKFSAVKKPTVAKSKQKGFVLYEGASVLDGAPIVVVATLRDKQRQNRCHGSNVDFT